MIRHRVRLKATKTSLGVIRVTRVLVTLTQVRTNGDLSGVVKDGFGVTRCGLEDMVMLVPTRFLLRYHHVSTDFSSSWTRNNRVVREGKWREKSPVCGFCPFFWRSSVRQHSFARDKLRVGGEIHVSAHSVSAEYHLVSADSSSSSTQNNKALRVIRVY